MNADFSRTCEGCEHVVTEPWAKDILSYRCFAPGRCKGRVVGVKRFDPYKIAQIRASARSILCAGTAHGPPPFSKSNKKNSPPLALSEKIWFCCGKALIFLGNRAILITSEIVFLRM